MDNIASLKRDLLAVDRSHKAEIREQRDRVATLEIQQEDIDSQLGDYTELTHNLENRVGLAVPH